MVQIAHFHLSKPVVVQVFDTKQIHIVSTRNIFAHKAIFSNQNVVHYLWI